MKVSIVTCFESNEERVNFVYEACKKREYEVEVITSDFSHIKKEKRRNIPELFKAIKTLPYSKNLSIARIRSHIKFAKNSFALIEEYKPDLIWVMAPCNSLIKEANNYKKKYPDTKIIVDIIDMWPESLPIKINKNYFPFSIWKNIRKNNLNVADALVTECDFYQEILNKEYDRTINTIHWARDEKIIKEKINLPNDKLSLCYIGSINNIIDIDLIKKIIEQTDKKVILHIIGEGENKDLFIETMKDVCEVTYHGPIRDQKEKNEIFNKCHAGINVYREGLYIGLTVKCIDYFENGLPIINNIKGDTWDFVNKNNAGINIYSNIKIDSQMLINMRANNEIIYDLYNNYFTKDVFIKKCLDVIDGVIK